MYCSAMYCVMYCIIVIYYNNTIFLYSYICRSKYIYTVVANRIAPLKLLKFRYFHLSLNSRLLSVLRIKQSFCKLILLFLLAISKLKLLANVLANYLSS